MAQVVHVPAPAVVLYEPAVHSEHPLGLFPENVTVVPE